MDVLYFLRRRTNFLRSLYRQTSAIYQDTKRRIDVGEPPFDNPPYDESGDPAYLSEWEDADEAIEVLGQACVSFLSGSLKLFLNEAEQEMREMYDPLPDKDAPTFKKQGFVGGYREWFASMGIKLEDSGVDLNVISEIVFTRNMSEHSNSIMSLGLSQDESARKKFPRPFFANPIEQGLFEQHLSEDPDGAVFGGLLSIQPHRLEKAIDAVETLCVWLEPQYLGGPKQLP